jgi:hypothetical protein
MMKLMLIKIRRLFLEILIWIDVNVDILIVTERMPKEKMEIQWAF